MFDEDSFEAQEALDDEPSSTARRSNRFDPWDDSGLGLLANELPFRPWIQWRWGEDFEERLELAPLKPAPAEMRRALIANLRYMALRGPEWRLFYSRDWNHYRDARKYAPDGYSRINIIAAVESLEEAGLIEHLKTAPSRFAEYRSRIWPTATFLERLGRASLKAFDFRPRELIMLRDADKRLMEYRESRDISRLRKDVAAHNAFLSSHEIELDHPDAHVNEAGFIVVGGSWVNPQRGGYYRVFNRSFTRGGRWYGPWWQGLPSRVRSGIRIGGARTRERDFAGCHLRLLSAMAGIEAPSGDPYAIPGFDRKQVKLAFNISLNADDAAEAGRALAQRYTEAGIPTTYTEARQAMRAVEDRFPGFERFWNTGFGLRLQNLDATVCQRVQRRTREAGVPVLSVHDSFIAKEQDYDFMSKIMDQEMFRTTEELSK